jgi:hypothetical protein
MKFLYVLGLMASVALAADLDPRQSSHPRKTAARPKKISAEQKVAAAAARRPSGAPSAYKTGLDSTSRKRAKSALKKLPSELIDAKRLRVRQTGANDFYECQAAVRFCVPFSRETAHCCL